MFSAKFFDLALKPKKISLNEMHI